MQTMLRFKRVFNAASLKLSALYGHCPFAKRKEPYLLSRIYKSSSSYIEQMYNAWLRDPTSVHRSWDSYFRSPPNLVAADTDTDTGTSTQPSSTLDDASPVAKAIDDHAAVHALIRTYQTQGYNYAKLDPIYDEERSLSPIHKDFHFLHSDLEREFRLPSTTFVGGESPYLPLREIIQRLDSIYLGKIGVEYMFINSPRECNWIREHFEIPGVMQMSSEEQRIILTRLVHTATFEKFLTKKFPTEKRFSIEGCEMLIPALKKVIDVSSAKGIQLVILGMPQRGRLNTLANVCKKPLNQVFSLFMSNDITEDDLGNSKYSIGTTVEREVQKTNRNIQLIMTATPSHPEAVNPVVQGRTRAEQHLLHDNKGTKAMSILVHGDGAFSGQGVVYETMNLSTLPNYTTHGTIHFVVNNRNRLMVNPSNSAISPYCTDVAHAINAPIFHVNADDPEAVVHVSKVAAEWRATFNRDVVVNLIGYTRNCGKDGNDLMYKFPLLSQKIIKHKPCLETYANKLVRSFIVTQEELENDIEGYEEHCQDAFETAKLNNTFEAGSWVDTKWSDFFENKPLKLASTGVDGETLFHIGDRFLSPPSSVPDFVVDKALHAIMVSRRVMLEKRIADWGLSEVLAFGTLLKDGIHVRLSGHDVERGTFSQRHHVLHHQLADNTTYNALQNLYPNQAQYFVSNSSLSEYAVLGFEHGYSMANPNVLVLWESQYGDFASTAQCIIDQFISSGQSKWSHQSGLVMLLPHGMEGMGPDQSSARLERFLQLCPDDPEYFPQDMEDFWLSQLRDTNWIVANCTTPANYFHILRRQTALPFRKPLILMTPKSLLRHPDVKSSFDDMCKGTEFQRIIPDNGPAQNYASAVRRVVFCSGHIYYDLLKTRNNRELDKEIAIVRVEQISPFPFDLIKKQLELYETADILWVQEEHKNQGAWPYVQPRFQTVISDSRIMYMGRPYSSLTATNSKSQHSKELCAILNEAISLETLPNVIENW